MTKKLGFVIVSFVLFSLVVSGCKMPASKAPETPIGETKTTPIVIQTDAPAMVTQTEVAKTTEATAGEPETSPTNTPEPTKINPVPTVTRPAEYTLQEGEYIYCIARRFNLDPADILAVNGLGENDLLSPGDTLQIPQTGSWEGAGRVRNPHPDTYTVDPGDTIYAIACYYGDVSPEAIIAVNELEEPYDLTPGQTLQIP
ncbi:MAG: LysM peptidoglycan-binding domain-containing protein [Chloroflexota bacterium]|nr:LysM peptidoglycan-binding domain-containing protein [Chloroflexota bacterium]